MSQFSIANCLQQSTNLKAVSETPRLDIEIILCHILQKNRTYLFTWPEKLLTEIQCQQFDEFIARRLKGEPIAHIIGQREFWSLPFLVNNTTLIPRPDTELIVETTLALFAQDDNNRARRLLDLGTGSGAILLSLAHEKKLWQCVGVDREIAAVELAEKNRVQLQIDNVSIFQSNWFSAIDNQFCFDVIVSNPPYIDPTDEHLLQGDVRFEPLSALVADNNGLADLEIIISQASNYLQQSGWLLVEHGYDQGDSVRQLFTHNQYQQVKTLCDLGNNERITIGQKNT